MARAKKRRRRKRYHTGVHSSPKSGGDCRYRSGWELAYMLHLDAADDVVSYTYERTPIPYTANVRSGRVRTYYPDLLVTMADGVQRLVEIKPSRKLGQSAVSKKLAAAAEWCSELGIALDVITEVELKRLGLL